MGRLLLGAAIFKERARMNTMHPKLKRGFGLSVDALYRTCSWYRHVTSILLYALLAIHVTKCVVLAGNRRKKNTIFAPFGPTVPDVRPQIAGSDRPLRSH